MSRALEELLKSQYTNPVDSSGEFTMQAEKALEKIAKYQLPYPDAWVVKLGQGVVLSGAESLKIHQSSTDTTFIFTPRERLEFELTQSFFDPSDNSMPWWQHFRSALWAVGINLRRPFKINFFGAEFFWDGFELHKFEGAFGSSRLSPSIILDLSHRTVEQGKGIPIFRSIQAAWLNSQLRTVFSEVLFSCPIRVSVDGLPIEGFQRVPNHGFSSENHPIKMIWLQGEPGLAIPPSTQDNLGHFLGTEKLRGLTHYFDSRPTVKPVRAAALVSAHAYYYSGKNSEWRTPTRRSVIYWIRHGVVIQKEAFDFPALCVSMAVFASCEHIATDVTGFGLEERAKEQALAEICKGLDSAFTVSDLDLELHDREQHKSLMKLAGGVAASGLLLKFIFPPALVLTGAGGLGAVLLHKGIATVDKAVNRDLAKLRDEWYKLSQSL